MAEESGFAEQENKPASKWQRLKDFSRNIFRRSESRVQENNAVIKEPVKTVPSGSGYAALIESLKAGADLENVTLAAILNNEYPSLLSTVSLDTRLSNQTKDALLGRINNGDMRTIAVITERLLESVKKESKVSTGTAKVGIKDRILKLSFLTRRGQKAFIANQVNEDNSPRLLSIKQHDARLQYFNAIKQPAWLPEKLSSPLNSDVLITPQPPRMLSQ